jgi:hypothetical protein
MRGIEPDDSEMAYRSGYEAGAIEAFNAVEQLIDNATREGLRAWIDDVLGWRTKADAWFSADVAVENPTPPKDF